MKACLLRWFLSRDLYRKWEGSHVANQSKIFRTEANNNNKNPDMAALLACSKNSWGTEVKKHPKEHSGNRLEEVKGRIIGQSYIMVKTLVFYSVWQEAIERFEVALYNESEENYCGFCVENRLKGRLIMGASWRSKRLQLFYRWEMFA